MRSKTSFYSVSGAIIREDFRKFWLLPVLFSIGFFLFGIFILLMKGDAEYEYPTLVHSILTGQYFPYTMLMAAMPLAASLLVFSYLNSMGSVMSVHSQPFSRNMLINSHSIASFLLCVIPILFTGVVLMIMAHPTYFPESYYSPDEQMYNLFTRSEVLQWFLESMLSVLFVLAVCIFARMITGTAVHNSIAAIGFNLVVPGMMILFLLLGSSYLYGFSTDSLYRMVMKTSPLLNSFNNDHFSALFCVGFLLISLVLYGFSMHLYNIRKLERTTRGVVFEPFNYIITWIFTFSGMTLLGELFHYIFDSTGIRLAGYIFGATLGFIVCRIIVEKTLRIAGKKTGIMFMVCIVISGCVIGAVAMDVFGYEKRMCRDADLVTISGLSTGSFMYSNSVDLKGDDMKMADALHRYLIENKDAIVETTHLIDEANDQVDTMIYQNYENLSFVYYKNDRIVFNREYRVPQSMMLIDNDAYQELTGSDAFRQVLVEEIPAVEKWRCVQVCNGQQEIVTVEDGDVPAGDIYDESDMKSLYDAYKMDLKTADISSNLVNMINKNGCVTLGIVYREPSAPENEWATEQLTVYDCYTNTINWLRQHGYDHAVCNLGGASSFAAVYRISDDGINASEIYNKNWEDSYTIDSVKKIEGFTMLTENADEMSGLYARSIETSILGTNISTDKDNIYLLVLFSESGDEKDSINYIGYINGNDFAA